ncbi:MAG: tetratricopeptide repeat protein, partial [Phycisphaerae bacterium]|nr:tetratricopeptide repeat protein [Phycisphaerae bacterium]
MRQLTWLQSGGWGVAAWAFVLVVGPVSAAWGQATAEAEAATVLKPPSVLVKMKVDLQPRRGIARQKAQLRFDDLIEKLPTPAYLSGKAEPVRGDGPPAAAVKAYVRGRASYRAGLRWEAINQLEQAHRLDPRSPQILRLLGTIYFVFGNEVKGAGRLAQAVELEPDDAQSLFLLGRFAYRKGRWDEAIVALARSASVEQKRVDPAVRFLRPYYIGQALLQQGYDQAAVDQLTEYLKLPERLGRTTRLHQELAFLSRQRGRVRMQAADALCRLERFEDALARYEAAGAGAADQQLVARRVYVLLALDRSPGAERTLVDQLRRERAATPALLDLVSYVATHSGDRARLVQRITGVYEETERPAALAMAVAKLLEPPKAASFLIDHLTRRPDDLKVYSQIVTDLAARAPGQLAKTTIDLIARRPDAARDYTDALVRGAAATEPLLKSLDQLPADTKGSPAAWYLRGALNEHVGQVQLAAEAYDKALEGNDKFLSPHLATVNLRLRLKQYDKALAVLDRIKDADDPKVRFARIKVFAGLKRYDEATGLLDKLLAQQPRNVEFRLFKANLQRQRNDFAGAERTLRAVLDFDQLNEDAYGALFELFERDPRANQAQWVNLLKEVQQNIPASRIARLKMAEWWGANRQFDRAEQALRQLLVDDPGDHRALAILVDVFKRANDYDKAEKFLLEHIRKRPDDRVPLLLLEPVAERLEHLDLYYARQEAYWLRQRPSFDKFVQLAQLYSSWEKPEKAVAALNEAIAVKPEVAAEFRMDLARLYNAADKLDLAVAQIDLAIKEQPDRAADLYYFKA